MQEKLSNQDLGLKVIELIWDGVYDDDAAGTTWFVCTALCKAQRVFNDARIQKVGVSMQETLRDFSSYSQLVEADKWELIEQLSVTSQTILVQACRRLWVARQFGLLEVTV